MESGSNTWRWTSGVEALEEALSKCKSEIFNTDQKNQFTSDAFTGMLPGARHSSQHGRHERYTDPDVIRVEQLWRSIKY